jgi:hypothetical protein
VADYKKIKDISPNKSSLQSGYFDSFVLEKSIFSKVFEKDIKRVYIYKKAERLAKAVHLICPAFVNHPALKDKIDAIAVGLIEAAIRPPFEAREALSRELLALSSVLAIAKTGNALSPMNAEIIAKEAHTLLQELAGYEEPKISLESMPSLAFLMKQSDTDVAFSSGTPNSRETIPFSKSVEGSKGHIKDKSDRRESIMAVLRSKGPSFIKDISTVVRDISEKTIQRELQALVLSGRVRKEGDKRWTKYIAV